MKSKNMTALPRGNSVSHSLSLITSQCSLLTLPRWRRAWLFFSLVLCCFALLPAVQAVTPAPDGGYPGANTAEGTNALFSLASGIDNTGLGFQALYHNTIGNYNTAEGFRALFNNTSGGQNTATGVNALISNTTGSENTANGVDALFSNTTGIENAANGFEALAFNTTGAANIANGFKALYGNTTGFDNTANGSQALLRNTTGNHNTATGDLALVSNTTGNFNTTDGAHSLVLNTTGTLNIVLGFAAGQNLTTGSNNIDVANRGVAAESNTIRIGNQVAFTDMDGIVHPAHTKTFIAGIHGVAVTGTAVVVSSNGQLGVAPSSKRFKEQIKPMDKASEAILALKPVTFRYKHELDPDGIPQFGLVAEQVAKVNPDLVARDAKGEVYTVRYEAVNAMLLNEFLKEHRKVEEQEATITQVKSTAAKQEATITQLKFTVAQQQKDFQASIAQQQTQIEALTAGLQRASAQVEMSRPAPQMVLNNQ